MVFFVVSIGIIDALPEKERSQGISFYSLFSYIPGVIGPVLALGLWQTGGMDSFTVIFVAIAICTGLFGYSVKMDRDSLHQHFFRAGSSFSLYWRYSHGHYAGALIPNVNYLFVLCFTFIQPQCVNRAVYCHG